MPARIQAMPRWARKAARRRFERERLYDRLELAATVHRHDIWARSVRNSLVTAALALVVLMLDPHSHRGLDDVGGLALGLLPGSGAGLPGVASSQAKGGWFGAAHDPRAAGEQRLWWKFRAVSAVLFLLSAASVHPHSPVNGLWRMVGLM
jgi:hypothetical protein